MTNFGSRPWIVISGNILALGFTAILFFIMYQMKTPYYQNLLICILGWLVGWGIGILATPFNKKESEQFVTIGQTISVFISGYVFSKLDRFLELSLFSQTSGTDATGWERLGLFTASVLSMTIIVFLNRTYMHSNYNPSKHKTTVTENRELEITTEPSQ